MHTVDTTATLTADDVKALRQAEQVVFRMTGTEATIEAGIGTLFDDEARYTAAQRRVFPDQATGSSDRERTVEVSGRVMGYADGAFNKLPLRTGFAMLHTAQQTPTWTTIASLLRAGDHLRLDFQGDAHTNEHLRKAGMHGDVLRLQVVRQEGPLLTFEVTSSTGPDNTARMVQA